MAEDTIVSMYEMAEDLLKAGRLEEALPQYKTAYDFCKSSADPDAQSRQKYLPARSVGF